MINILCYNAKGDLVMAQVGADTEKGDILTIEGTDYAVTDMGSARNSFSGATRVVDLAKYKEEKRKAV